MRFPSADAVWYPWHPAAPVFRMGDDARDGRRLRPSSRAVGGLWRYEAAL